VPESSEQFWQRANGALRVPPVEEWERWPFDGTLELRPLTPPVEAEPPRHGEGGVECRRCTSDAADALWSNDNLRVTPLPAPSALPAVVCGSWPGPRGSRS
jgi:hypothetical protein